MRLKKKPAAIVSHRRVCVCVFITVAEKVTSLGKDWHRPCLRCERCSKTLAPGSHAEVRTRSWTLRKEEEKKKGRKRGELVG